MRVLWRTIRLAILLAACLFVLTLAATGQTASPFEDVRNPNGSPQLQARRAKNRDVKFLALDYPGASATRPLEGSCSRNDCRIL